ncbi:MAG: hypothetical protein JSW65_08585 [Candidatus Bipolaricaulota bacterium]|nr:MAG: hypothetical protein JSW65_08585 [Candidatus Bipolaricaulota bacterium]
MRTAVRMLGIVSLVAAMATLAGAQEIMTLSEIRVGMTGTGKTIVSGEQPTDFAVEILGIIDEPGEDDDFIVARVSGAAIGRAGGIAQGMSGSPVYIDGRLIGALSRAANWSKDLTPIGLITPIEPMLSVLEAVQGDEISSSSREARIEGVTVLEVDMPLGLAFDPGLPDALVSVPLTAPILASGLSPRAVENLMGTATAARPDGLFADFVVLPPAAAAALRLPGLSRFGLSLSPVAAAPVRDYGTEASFVPGGSIGVALATGDITIGALGTVTYRDGNDVIGFGHPFLSNGPSAFPLTAVQIYDTIKSYQASFKLGSLGRSLGVVLEDRAPAVGGRIGSAPPMIALDVEVVDEDVGQTRAFAVEIVPESRLIPELLFATGLAAVDEALDRVGAGTVEVTFTFDGDGLPRPATRRDVFLSAVDVAVYPAWQWADIAAFLEYNPFVDPGLHTVSMSVTITEEIHAVEIAHLEIDRLVYMPGDTLRYALELQTYRGERRYAEGEILIPADVYTDTIAVRAYGGPRLREAGEAPNEFGELEDMIELIESLPSHDVLTVELFGLDVLAPFPEAWVGLERIEVPFDGHVVYGEREVIAYLLESE